MATSRDLQEIFNSGEITQIKVGGTGTENEVVVKGDIEQTDFTDYTAGLPDPAHKEGRLYYDDLHKALSYYTSEAGSALNIGMELIVRVYNDTGATIENGKPVSYSGGAHLENGVVIPDIKLSQADVFDNARTIGLATQAIPTGTVGLITAWGHVHGVDTSAVSVGQLFLSPTEAGGITNTAPDIITAIGACLNSDAVHGVIFAKINTNIALPNTYAMLEGIATPPTLTTSFQTLVNWTSSDSIVDSANTTTGVIVPHATGKYRVTGNFTATFDDISSGSRTIIIEVWDQTEATQEYVTTITVPKDSATGSRSFSRLLTVHATDEYVMRIRATDSFSNLVIEDVSFDITSINTR